MTVYCNETAALRAMVSELSAQVATLQRDKAALLESNKGLSGMLDAANAPAAPEKDSLGNPAGWQLCQRCESNPCVCHTGFRSIRGTPPAAPTRTDHERAVLEAMAKVHPRSLARPDWYAGDLREACDAELARRSATGKTE